MALAVETTQQTTLDARPTAVDGYYAIGLDCLYPELHAPCDLFRRQGKNQYVLWARQGLPFGIRSKENLRYYGTCELFVREEEAVVFFDYLRKSLERIVRDPSTPPRRKAEAVHASCKEILKKTFAEPRSQFLGKAQEILKPTMDLIIHEDAATKWLVQLTAYDHSTYNHSTNVGIFAIALAKLIYGNAATHDLRRLGAGFFLHDLGKCEVPLEIINKPGPLNDEEWGVVRRHPEEGFSLIESAGILTPEAKIVSLQHHEKEDGSGYPLGLKKGDIHPYARICRLADVYEALTSERPYHNQRTTFEALKLMKEKVLADMDQDLFEHFLQIFHVR